MLVASFVFIVQWIGLNADSDKFLKEEPENQVNFIDFKWATPVEE